MRALAVVLAACVVTSSAVAEIGKTRRVGPWNVGAVAEKGEFRHCIMARPETDRSVGFGVVRGRNYLALAMFSKKWKLETGSSYAVTLAAGGDSEDLQAKVEGPTSVLVDLTGREAFVEAWGRARTLEVRTPASTLRLPLDQSGPALRTLDSCFAAEAKVAANPFGAPGQKPASAANPFGPAPGATKPAEAAKPPPAAPAAPPQAQAPAPAAPPPVDAAYAKSRADCEQDEDPDRQIAGCTAVVESGREPPQVRGIAYANRGFGYKAKGDLVAAMASFSDAIRLYPGYPNGWWGRADVHYARGNYDAAIADYDEVLRLLPNDADFLNSRAMAKLRKGELDRALADAEEAVKHGQKSAAAYDTRAHILAAKGDHKRALADYDEALRLSPNLAAAVEGRKRVEAALAAGAGKRREAAAAEAVTAAGVLEVAPQTCGFTPSLPALMALAGETGVGPETLASEPHASAKRKAAEEAAAAARADKAAFCNRVWAEYGAGGTRLAGLVSR